MAKGKRGRQLECGGASAIGGIDQCEERLELGWLPEVERRGCS